MLLLRLSNVLNQAAVCSLWLSGNTGKSTRNEYEKLTAPEYRRLPRPRPAPRTRFARQTLCGAGTGHVSRRQQQRCGCVVCRECNAITGDGVPDCSGDGGSFRTVARGSDSLSDPQVARPSATRFSICSMFREAEPKDDRGDNSALA